MEQKFELRELKSSDMFPMFGILSKIGFKELKERFTPEKIQNLVNVANGEEGDSQTILGFNLIFEIVEVVISNLPSAEKEIYKFLSGISGMSEKEVADMSMVGFTEMIVAVVQKEEFKDFFKVVSGLFNQKN